MYGKISEPNRLKTDDDRSFKMSIVGVSRSEWQLVISALKELAETNEQVLANEKLNAVKRVTQCMQDLISGGSDGIELRECQPHEVITRKATKAERAMLRAQLANGHTK